MTQHPSERQFFDVPSFVPTKGAVEKLKTWWEQGAEICYLTSQRWNEHTEAVEATLRRFDFPPGNLYYRREGEEYLDVVARACPDVLIEDDCQSIGWDEVITPKLKAEWHVKGIVIPEFGGLAHLPDDHGKLLGMVS